MKDQILDVWVDLRDRRLWPVAAVMLLALVAVPLVVVKPAEEAPSQAAAASASAGAADPLAEQAVVKAFDSKPLVRISNLDQFSSKDPFKPLAQLKPLSKDSLVAATDTAGTKAPGGGDTGGGSGGGDTGGGTPDGGIPGGAPDSGAPEGDAPDQKPQAKYTYTVDLTFIDGEESKGHKGFERLGMLPSETSPLLVFLGVDTSGTKAAFLVDSSLQASGEGDCKPSTSDCGMVYLEAGQEHSFNDAEGHSYTLRIDQIHEVPAAKAARKPAAAVAKADPGSPTRRFQFPVLIDLAIGGQE